MDMSAIQLRIQALVELGGWSNVGSAIDYGKLANEGLRNVTELSQHNVEDLTFNTVASQAEYNLQASPIAATVGPSWIFFFDDASRLTKNILRKTSEANVRRIDPLWNQQSASSPAWWWMSKPDTIRLWPCPSAIEAVNFRGVRHEPALTDPTQVPLMPEKFHEAICLLGAYHLGKLYARGDDIEVCKGYLAEGNAMAMKLREQMSEADTGVIQRRVRRSQPEYLHMGIWPYGTR